MMWSSGTAAPQFLCWRLCTDYVSTGNFSYSVFTRPASNMMQGVPVLPIEPSHELPRDTLIVLGGLMVLLIYCFWNSLSLLGPYWEDPRYSHGWLVPVFAAALLWLRWDPSVLPRLDAVPAAARWWGVGLLTAGLSMRLVSATVGTEVPDMVAFLPSLAGVVLLVGGWRMLIWTGPVIAFLFFMFPLPFRVETALLNPLQKIATIGAEYVLQTLGYGAFREGNMIVVGERRLEVVEACSGLRMLTVFTAMTAAVAIIMDRPYWERAIIFLSALPIALAVNIIRISATGLGYYYGGEPWGAFFSRLCGLVHDGHCGPVSVAGNCTPGQAVRRRSGGGQPRARVSPDRPTVETRSDRKFKASAAFRGGQGGVS